MDKLRRSLYRKKRNVIKDAYCFLDINDIVANKEQPRTHFEDEKIQELAESIMQNGLLQPIVVREYEGKYQIVVGERRYRACKLAGITEVPCIIQELDDNQTANAALVENIQRENLSAIEEALAVTETLPEKIYAPIVGGVVGLTMTVSTLPVDHPKPWFILVTPSPITTFLSVLV